MQVYIKPKWNSWNKNIDSNKLTTVEGTTITKQNIYLFLLHCHSIHVSRLAIIYRPGYTIFTYNIRNICFSVCFCFLDSISLFTFLSSLELFQNVCSVVYVVNKIAPFCFQRETWFSLNLNILA